MQVAPWCTGKKLTRSVMTKVCRLRGAKSKSFAGEPHISSDCTEQSNRFTSCAAYAMQAVVVAMSLLGAAY